MLVLFSNKEKMKLIFQTFFLVFLLEYSHQSPIEIVKIANISTDYDVEYDEYDYIEFGVKITDGKNAGKHEFPSLVALLFSDGRQFCGGTVIHKRFVATAAHCFRGQ